MGCGSSKSVAVVAAAHSNERGSSSTPNAATGDERSIKELHESDTRLFLTDGGSSNNNSEENVIIGKKLEAEREEAEGSVDSDGASNTELLQKEELSDGSAPEKRRSLSCIEETEMAKPKSTDDSKSPLKKPYPLPHCISICIGGIPVLESKDLSSIALDQAICSMDAVGSQEQDGGMCENIMPPDDQATDFGYCKVSGEDQAATGKSESMFLQVPYHRSPSDLEEEKEAVELYTAQ